MLLPSYNHSDGVNLEKYSEEDDYFFSLLNQGSRLELAIEHESRIYTQKDIIDFTSVNNLEEKKKPHGNVEINAQKRLEVLGAALSVLAEWPDQCKNLKGNIEISKISELVDSKALLFWPDTGVAPLSSRGIKDLISKWLKKTAK